MPKHPVPGIQASAGPGLWTLFKSICLLGFCSPFVTTYCLWNVTASAFLGLSVRGGVIKKAFSLSWYLGDSRGRWTARPSSFVHVLSLSASLSIYISLSLPPPPQKHTHTHTPPVSPPGNQVLDYIGTNKPHHPRVIKQLTNSVSFLKEHQPLVHK